jgi:hypothetical protein
MAVSLPVLLLVAKLTGIVHSFPGLMGDLTVLNGWRLFMAGEAAHRAWKDNNTQSPRVMDIEGDVISPGPRNVVMANGTPLKAPEFVNGSLSRALTKMRCQVFPRQEFRPARSL